MNINKLDMANSKLQQQTEPIKRRYLWIIVGIIAGIIFIVVVLLFWWLRGALTGSGPGGSTYPYIPVPKNIVRSTSIPELLGNFILDTNDTAIDYSVISRPEILKNK
jgi:hypothetical protein